MKYPIVGLWILGVMGLTGCTQGTPGGPGTTDAKASKPAFGQAEETFNLSVPVLSSSIQQGSTMETTIGIKRGKNFKEDVTLQFDSVPEGVTIEPSTPMIKHSDTDTKVTIKAADEATLGDFKLSITGHPTNGGDAKVEFKLAVAAKDSFVLGMPLLSTSIKQGESKTISVAVKRDKHFDQDVTLSFGETPEGVSIEPATPLVKNGEKDVKITITSAKDAALGDFGIKVTGHPNKGPDAVSELKITIVKE